MEEKVEKYLEKLDTPQKEICLRLREIILETFPEIIEEYRWGVPAYSVRKDGKIHTKYYIGAMKDKVHLGFSITDLGDDDLKGLEGSGKTMRHVKFFGLKYLDKEKVIELLKMIPD
jgi:hypothetical protein